MEQTCCVKNQKNVWKHTMVKRKLFLKLKRGEKYDTHEKLIYRLAKYVVYGG